MAVPLLLGSNSADTAGNRIRATTKEQLFARLGKCGDQANAAYDPDAFCVAVKFIYVTLALIWGAVHAEGSVAVAGDGRAFGGSQCCIPMFCPL